MSHVFGLARKNESQRRSNAEIWINSTLQQEQEENPRTAKFSFLEVFQRISISFRRDSEEISISANSEEFSISLPTTSKT
jgi:hypothetical protein